MVDQLMFQRGCILHIIPSHSGRVSLPLMTESLHYDLGASENDGLCATPPLSESLMGMKSIGKIRFSTHPS